jgi:hypothetical protein
LLKIPFQFLRPEQAERLFRRTLEDLGGQGAEQVGGATAQLARTPNLTPGDFAAVTRIGSSPICPACATTSSQAAHWP